MFHESPHGMTSGGALGSIIRQHLFWGCVRIGEVADQGEGFTTRSSSLQALNGKCASSMMLPRPTLFATVGRHNSGQRHGVLSYAQASFLFPSFAAALFLPIPTFISPLDHRSKL